MVARLPFGWGCFIAVTGEFTPGLLWGREDRGQKLPPSGAESKHTDAIPQWGGGLCLSRLFSKMGSLTVQA